MSAPFRVISFGGGTQSSALLLMALEGRFGDRPDAAIFVDTHGEPGHVYDWIEFMRQSVAPFPIHVCSGGDLGKDALAGKRRASLPYHSTGQDGRPTLLKRFCSSSYKVKPFLKMARSLAPKGAQIETWLGISMDEAHRMKTNPEKRFTNRYPLVDSRLSRQDCIEDVERRLGHKPPRSACFFCPFRSDREWIQMKEADPAAFERALRFDEEIRKSDPRWGRDIFLHRSLRPLGEAPLMHESQGAMFVDQFGNECEGVCGT